MKKKKVDPEKITQAEWPKYEIAKELGYYERILSDGWGSLTAKEAGRIGGILHHRRRCQTTCEAEEVCEKLQCLKR